MKDAVILVSTILVLLIIITVFGGCVSCSNGRHSTEGLTVDGGVSNTIPANLMPPPTVAAVAPIAEPAQATTTVQGYDSSDTEFAAFRTAT